MKKTGKQLCCAMKTASCTAALLLCFTGCGFEEKEPPVKITLMHGWGGNSADHIAMRQIYEEFDEKNSDIELVCDVFPDLGNVVTEVNKMMAVGKLPDIVSTNGMTDLVRTAEKKEYLLDLSPYIQNDESFRKCISEKTFATWTEKDGSIYTLPDIQEYVGYWYNADLLRQAGITDTGDSTGKIKLPSTWQELFQVWKKVEETTGVTAVYITSDQLKWLFGAALAANDTISREYMQKQAAFCIKEDVLGALDILKQMEPYYIAKSNWLDQRQFFAEGKTAFYLNGVWGNIEQEAGYAGQSIGYAAYPSNTSQSIAYCASTSGYMVSNRLTEKQQDACIRFLKYMVSEPVQKTIVLKTHQAPQNPSVTVDWIMKEIPSLGSAIEICKGADIAIEYFSIIEDGNINSNLEDIMEDIVGKQDRTEELFSILTDFS